MTTINSLLIKAGLQHLAKQETIGFWQEHKYIYSYTGTRRLDARGEEIIDDWLHRYCYDAVKFITGACPGVDAYVQRRALEIYPHLEHEVIVPGGFVSGIDWVVPHDARVNVIRLPPPPPTIKGTKIRNALLVARAQRVMGFADYPERHGKSKYSGTWQTLRMAVAAEKMYMMKVFNEYE